GPSQDLFSLKKETQNVASLYSDFTPPLMKPTIWWPKVAPRTQQRSCGDFLSPMEKTMLSAEESTLLTQTNAGAPMGEYFRSYWLPALLASELPAPDCPPIRICLAGEDLIAFRDSNGRVGLLDEVCAHRRASLFWGRNEECGLRCVYHGWKYDVTGACVEMPNEPPEYAFENKVRTTAYPTREYGGASWGGNGAPASRRHESQQRVGGGAA